MEGFQVCFYYINLLKHKCKQDVIKRAVETDATSNTLLRLNSRDWKELKSSQDLWFSQNVAKDGLISTWKSLAVQQITASWNLLTLTLCPDSTKGRKMTTRFFYIICVIFIYIFLYIYKNKVGAGSRLGTALRLTSDMTQCKSSMLITAN